MQKSLFVSASLPVSMYIVSFSCTEELHESLSSLVYHPLILVFYTKSVLDKKNVRITCKSHCPGENIQTTHSKNKSPSFLLKESSSSHKSPLHPSLSTKYISTNLEKNSVGRWGRVTLTLQLPTQYHLLVVRRGKKKDAECGPKIISAFTLVETMMTRKSNLSPCKL